MRRKGKLPELLAPAGDLEALYAAVQGGADAVYVGGKSFGARAFAKNFDIDELSLAAEYCHLHGVKLYVTVNTLVFDKEMSELSDYVKELWRVGVDAVISADLGVISEIRRRVPDMEVHASTQMSVHNVSGAEAAFSLGCTRVVPARELSLENIRDIVERASAEVEVFLHGALCVCHSGQCLMSSMVGGRSGNRGECAQPCRLPYNNGKYPLSLKDLALCDHIRELIDSGVASLKIEGRMKSAQYVYAVTSIYRKLLDEGRNATSAEREQLARIFSRDGFTDGYFVGNVKGKMTGIRSESDKQNTRLEQSVAFKSQKVKATAEVVMRLAEPIVMTLRAGERSVTVSGQAPAIAQNSPLTEEAVKERLSKTGNTYISLSPSDISLTLEEGINLPPSAINALRRDAISELVKTGREAESAAPPYIFSPRAQGAQRLRTAQFFDGKQYDELSGRAPKLCAEFDIAFVPLTAFSSLSNKPNGVAIPPVIFDTEWGIVDKMLEEAFVLGAKYALVGNIGAISLAKRHSLIPIGDFRLNVTNAGSEKEYSELGVKTLIASPELTLPMARDIGGGVIVYGRIPLMLTERCFMRESFGCDKCSRCYLRDRTGAEFPMMREFPHRNIIFNSTPTYMGDKKEELHRAKLMHEHFIFSDERAEEIADVITKYDSGAPLGKTVRRMGKR